MKPVNTFKVSSNNYSFIYRLLDLICISLSLLLVTETYELLLTHEYIILGLSIAITFLYIAEALNLYQTWRVGRFYHVMLTVTAVFIYSFAILFAVGYWLQLIGVFSNELMFTWFAFAMFCCFAWRVIKHQWIIIRNKLGINQQRMAIMGATDSGMNLRNEIMSYKELSFDFVGFFDDRNESRDEKEVEVHCDIAQGIQLAKKGQIDVLFIALPTSAEKRISEILTLLADTTVDVYVVPEIMLSDVMQGRIMHVGQIDTISVFESPYLGTKIWLKRIEDIIISVLCITLLSPVYLVIAIILKLTSPGPILFKQKRYGLRGQEINVFKFRSMNVQENGAVVKQAQKDDDRITPFGKFLRRSSLDELPQFFNVLIGDMSVVGPRPHAISHNEEYRELVQFYMLRHHVKPGITGWAQVSGYRGETDTLEKMEKRIEFDIHYIMQWSIWFDLKILLLTPVSVIKTENAY